MTGPSRHERLDVVQSHRDSHGVVLVLYGDLDAGTALKLEQAAAQLFNTAYPPEVLFLDLSGLSFLSVGGARAILAVHESAGMSRVRVVTGDRPAVREFLHATRFDAVLDCYRTRMGAIAAGSRSEFMSRVKTIWEAG
ncbi:STAS domain-containing protein [Amycolatopsis sp. Hca4]|uniref:STAS domain-containing protein n=1 Tax=Amycolatopsis sp. Hca4 TaxID=2742131 RepID=UPI0020CB0A32|nr:STAS domain-containing protein [Amycolatopsis sp. Hca4]